VSDLVDTSALIMGARHPLAMGWFREALARDEVATCDVIAIEFLMGARDVADFVALEASLRAMRWLIVEPADWSRAIEVQRGLAAVGPGHQRSVRLPDLVIAAVAERNSLAIVHYDEDYDRIATITGQPTRWVLPRGSA
jgi:predicted nucleic acid-binding protein